MCIRDRTRQAIKNSVQAAGTDALSVRIISEMPDTLEGYLEQAAQNGEVQVDENAVYGVDILVPRYYSCLLYTSRCV